MSQALNNPASRIHRDYGATSSATPEVSFAAGTSSSGNSGFSPTELMSLSENIGHNITTIHCNSKQLEKKLKLIGTSKDLPTLRNDIHRINADTNACVRTTSQDLQRLQSVVPRGDRQQKFQLEKLRHEFEAVVNKYSDIQNKISKAVRQSYQLAAEEERKSVVNATTELLQQQREEQAQLTQNLGTLIEFEHQMKTIEADIIDVNVIMQKLNAIVAEQGADVGEYFS